MSQVKGTGSKMRRVMQEMTCRAALSKHLEGAALEAALFDLRDAMRHGPQSWAFKAAEQEVPDERVYYSAGGVV